MAVSHLTFSEYGHFFPILVVFTTKESWSVSGGNYKAQERGIEPTIIVDALG